jgi:carotenoid cleavage dioxygenase
MVFHVGNAHDTRDGEVVLSYIGAPDAGFLDEGAVALLAGRRHEGSASQTRQLRLHLASGRVQTQAFAGEVEFPRVHPQLIGLPARWLLTGAGWPAHAGRAGLGLLHGVQLLDTHTGRSRRYDYGAHAIAEEHVFVPKPGKTGELDAWLLGTTFDARRQATVLNLLDAAHIEDGPIAQAVLPYALPLGFHGNFTGG